MMKRLSALTNKYGFIAYPLLFALFPLLSFYGSNASEIKSGDFQLGTFVIFNLIVGAICWALSLALTRNKKKASILTVAFLAVFFTLGRAHNAMQGFVINTPVTPIGPSKALLLASVLFIGLAWFWVRRLSPESVAKINSTLTLVATAVVASTLISVVPALASGGDKKSKQAAQVQTGGDGGKNVQDRPDIYYILLDGYARADFYKNEFGYDNSGFVNSLKDKGFYVAEKSHSNYAHTHFSMPSTFNMKYLNYLTEQMGEESTDRAPLKELLDNNEVVPIFKSFGYKYIQFGDQWGWSEKSPLSDIDVKAKKNTESKIFNIKLDEFALVYMQTTALKPWVSKDIRNNLVTKVLGSFEKIEEASHIEGPTLTYAHIVTPHPPYLFDRDGIIQGKSKLELLNDGFSDKDKYVDQTVYANKLVLDLVDKILKNSDKPPIIIIASDHGPASELKRSDFEQTEPGKLNEEGIKERMSNLEAYYFPDQDYSNLYPTITPVNNFRVILKQYFNQDIKLLPDRSYFSNNKANEYRMLDVTDLVK